MKCIPFFHLALVFGAFANTAPTVVIQSAAMRPGTTFMDVVYRVSDPDDATVKTRALAFVDGVRSFANVIKPVTFVEGTAANLGDAIPANVNHTLTWDVAADWDIDLGQVKFEVMAMDGRGLLPFDWITIPAAGGKPTLTVSKNSPTDAEVLNALFWQYAVDDSGLSLNNGVLSGNSNSGAFNLLALVNGSTLQGYSTPFLFKRMDLDTMDSEDLILAMSARAGLSASQGWHAVNRPYQGTQMIIGWGLNTSMPANISTGLTGITAISAGRSHSLALKNDGTVVGWGSNSNGQISIPTGLNGVIAVAAGGYHSLALKSDGSVVGWGNNYNGQASSPTGNDFIAIAAGSEYSLAVKSDGTVIGWGRNLSGSITIPVGLSGVIAVAAAHSHSIALRADGTVVGWGSNGNGATNIPAGLSGVVAIAAGGGTADTGGGTVFQHTLALKEDGTVVGWGSNSYGQATIPVGLTSVTAIAAGGTHSLALRSDGTVAAWGYNGHGQISIPAGLSGVTAIAAGGHHSVSLKAKTP